MSLANSKEVEHLDLPGLTWAQAGRLCPTFTESEIKLVPQLLLGLVLTAHPHWCEGHRLFTSFQASEIAASCSAEVVKQKGGCPSLTCFKV